MKCNVCGKEFEPVFDKHYVARDDGETGLVVALASKPENKLYDVFNCPHCGCQAIAQERKRGWLSIEVVDDKKRNKIVEDKGMEKMKIKDNGKNDVVKEPNHYQQGSFEVIDEMLIVFGPQKTFDFCVMNSWKYRCRAPFKEKMEQDMDKANRYLEMAREVQKRNPEVAYNDGFGKLANLIKATDR